MSQKGCPYHFIAFFFYILHYPYLRLFWLFFKHLVVLLVLIMPVLCAHLLFGYKKTLEETMNRNFKGRLIMISKSEKASRPNTEQWLAFCRD